MENLTFNQSKTISPILSKEVLTILTNYKLYKAITEEQAKLVYCSILKNTRITLDTLDKSFDRLLDIAQELVNECITYIFELPQATYKQVFNHIACYYYNQHEKQSKTKAPVEYADNIAEESTFAVAEATAEDYACLYKAKKALESRNFSRVKQATLHQMQYYTPSELEDLISTL